MYAGPGVFHARNSLDRVVQEVVAIVVKGVTKLPSTLLGGPRENLEFPSKVRTRLSTLGCAVDVVVDTRNGVVPEQSTKRAERPGDWQGAGLTEIASQFFVV